MPSQGKGRGRVRRRGGSPGTILPTAIAAPWASYEVIGKKNSLGTEYVLVKVQGVHERGTALFFLTDHADLETPEGRSQTQGNPQGAYDRYWLAEESPAVEAWLAFAVPVGAHPLLLHLVFSGGLWGRHPNQLEVWFALPGPEDRR